MKIKNSLVNHLFNFLAVILGVYLAFFINEVAKKNQDRKESLLLMQSLVKDLEGDIKTYESYHIPVNIQQQEAIEELWNSILSDNPDSLSEQLSMAIQVENYNPTTSTYSAIKSSGKLALIEDLSLRKKLADYYETLAMESTAKANFQISFFENELLPWLMVNVDFLEMKFIKKDSLIVFRNKLIIYGSLIENKVESHKLLVEEAKGLKEYIEGILKAE